MAGELGLLRGRYDASLQDFRAAERSPLTAAAALQGQGIALARMGHNDEAMAELQKAVAASPESWRAWNALGSEYDLRRDWPHASEAYAKAISGSNGSPLVLNNRGYSQLLQGHFTDAIADFVAALQKKPDLTEARTNLRLAMALNGDYARSIAGADPENRAALLNNAGFAAGIRGDYAKAEDLLEEALKARGEFYDRASQNLKVIHTLEATPKTAMHDPE
jgi:Flp pilus assembly protein TadD